MDKEYGQLKENKKKFKHMEFNFLRKQMQTQLGKFT